LKNLKKEKTKKPQKKEKTKKPQKKEKPPKKTKKPQTNLFGVFCCTINLFFSF